MEIKYISENKKQFLDLLLLGDESEDMIDLYLNRGDMFALYDGNLKAVCVVTQEDNTTCELKNIAVYEQFQKQGYGAALMHYITEYYKGKYETMILGTGDVPSILSFYKKCGFELSHRIKNFFTDNYDHPMFEEGVQLIDMVYLKKSLK
ncbi:GNAT family N-acetyltransferase [Dysgonomonas sp. ZJ279]|uniref:GNAT family N-acetyltransferase n=1 Tax=Dysgonomonas sp. ZJ279 TaxID=2709796 RepID=UPI0013EE3C15|nr:GNAT family N-acetyltransferase [Dysgonomonas sp. ZJ279]